MKQIKQALYAVFSVALATAPAVAGAQWTVSNKGSGLPTGTITQIVTSTMNWLLALLGFLGIIGFVIAGILYLTAAGDEDQIEKAKTAMTYSIVGIIVALIGFVIIQAVNSWLGGNNTTF